MDRDDTLPAELRSQEDINCSVNLWYYKNFVNIIEPMPNDPNPDY